MDAHGSFGKQGGNRYNLDLIGLIDEGILYRIGGDHKLQRAVFDGRTTLLPTQDVAKAGKYPAGTMGLNSVGNFHQSAARDGKIVYDKS